MFGIEESEQEEHLSGASPDFPESHALAGVAAEFKAKPNAKWRNGYLPEDVELMPAIYYAQSGPTLPVAFKKGTPVRVYYGYFPNLALLGVEPKSTKLPSPKGNYLIEFPPTAPNLWMLYPSKEGVPYAKLTKEQQQDRWNRFYVGKIDPAKLTPFAEGEDKTLTDDKFNTVGAAAIGGPIVAPPPLATPAPAPTPEAQAGGGGLATLAIAGGLLLLLGKGK